ncbi:MAG: pgsA [Ignavibacteria bacterium]|nr:pgsA [Ignavibacteria bacterium]
MKLSLPNVISFIRILISPFVLILIVSDDPELVCISFILYCTAAITDYLDGYLARRFGAVTTFGKFFDPLADKFLTAAAFIGFVILNIVPLWMVAIVLIRDFGTTYLRVKADNTGKPLVTSYSAKLKTFAQMTYILFLYLLIFLKNISINSFWGINFDLIIFSNYTYYLMLGLTILSIWTALQYIFPKKNIKSVQV